MLQTSSSELKKLELFISILFKNTCSILLINHLSFFYPSVSQNVHHILLYLRIIIVLLFEKSNAWTFYLSHLFLRISKTCPIDYSFHLINLHFPTHGLLISSHLMYIQFLVSKRELLLCHPPIHCFSLHQLDGSF